MVSSGPASDGARCDAAGEVGPGSPSRIPRGLTGAVTPYTLTVCRASTASSSTEKTLRQGRGDEKRCSSVDRQDCVPCCCGSRIGLQFRTFQSNKPSRRTGVKGKAFADACRRGQLSVLAATVYCRARTGYLRELVALLPGLPRFAPSLCKPCICSRYIRATSTGYPMSSCRLSITSSGSITDYGWGTPLSRANSQLACLQPAGLCCAGVLRLPAAGGVRRV
jgi:hypothetical protein